MNVTITPGPLRGTVTPPASKSQAHRLVIAAALAPGTSTVRNLSLSRDIAATVECMKALGARADMEGDEARITGTGPHDGPLPELFCGESGSTLRFLIPVALALTGGGVFRGRGRLMQRPQEPYFEIFRRQGIAFSQNADTLTIQGTLAPGTFCLPGNVSSQFITGLLYALPLLDGDSEIRLTTDLESAGYVDMTLEALEAFGIRLEPTDRGWYVPGNQAFRPGDFTVEADYSQGAFFLAANSMGHGVTVTGLNPDSRQGDRVILEQLRRMAEPGDLALDVRDCPDLVPALAAAAALRDGQTTRITNAGRLRIKESDRLASVTAVLRALGAQITEGTDSLTILGRKILPGGVTVDSWNDHRIAMMAAIAAACCREAVTVTGGEAVEKSYPAFWTDFEKLGGKLEVEA